MSTLHITNGDSAAAKLRRIVDAPVTITADVLHEGPCPRVEGDAWHDVRARFLAANGDATHEEVKTALATWDQTIVDACQRGDEIVLWFEHDLFDQLALIRTLDLLVRLKPDTTEISATEINASGAMSAAVVSGSSRIPSRVSLICIGSFPGIDRFVGLGRLTTMQLSTLIGTGVPVTAGHFAMATGAWHAFRSPDPTALLEMTVRLKPPFDAAQGGPEALDRPGATDNRALPFLGEALLRFLAEFPSTVNGLSRTEALALHALLAGPTTAGALFGATQANETRPFMGDSTFFNTLRRLASGRVPLVTVDAGPDEVDLSTHGIAVTEAGRDVLARRADHIRLNGIDYWRGGVHLAGSDRSLWRWDASRETLVS